MSLLLGGVGFGQELLSSTTQAPKFKTLTPSRSVNYNNEILNDLEQYMPSSHIYRDSDKITWAHETTHGLNSKIKGVYVLDGKYVQYVEPKLTLATIATNVPAQWRGYGYQLYLVEQRRYFNDEPLYLLNELSAYFNGMVVEYQLKTKGLSQNRSGSPQHVAAFHMYVLTMLYLLDTQGITHDPEIEIFCLWFFERSSKVFKQYEKDLPEVVKSTRQYLSTCYNNNTPINKWADERYTYTQLGHIFIR